MVKWEYKNVKMVVDTEEYQLNAEGWNGWELVAFTRKFDAMRKEDIYTAVFKRPIDQTITE
jgi:hypothetical protein